MIARLLAPRRRLVRRWSWRRRRRRRLPLLLLLLLRVGRSERPRARAPSCALVLAGDTVKRIWERINEYIAAGQQLGTAGGRGETRLEAPRDGSGGG